MAALPQLAINVREVMELACNVRVLAVERGFLGTTWSFVTAEDGRTFWVNEKTGTVLLSSGQRK